MDREDFKATWKNLSARTAYLAAAAAAETIEPEIEGRHWWCMNFPEVAGIVGQDDEPTMRSQAIVALSEFTVANPTAPAESLYRFAAARELHLYGADDWSILPLHWRIAFEVFHEVLLTTERLFEATARRMAAEDDALAAARRAAEPPVAIPGLTGMIEPAPALGGGLIPRPKAKRKAAEVTAA